jgi:hypothetical protein
VVRAFRLGSPPGVPQDEPYEGEDQHRHKAGKQQVDATKNCGQTAEQHEGGGKRKAQKGR